MMDDLANYGIFRQKEVNETVAFSRGSQGGE